MYHVPHNPHGNDPSIKAMVRDLSFISSTGIILMFGLLLGLVAFSSKVYPVLAAVVPVIGGAVLLVRSYVQRKKAGQSLRDTWLAAVITVSALIGTCALVLYLAD